MWLLSNAVHFMAQQPCPTMSVDGVDKMYAKKNDKHIIRQSVIKSAKIGNENTVYGARLEGERASMQQYMKAFHFISLHSVRKNALSMLVIHCLAEAGSFNFMLAAICSICFTCFTCFLHILTILVAILVLVQTLWLLDFSFCSQQLLACIVCIMRTKH